MSTTSYRWMVVQPDEKWGCYVLQSPEKDQTGHTHIDITPQGAISPQNLYGWIQGLRRVQGSACTTARE